MDKLEKTVKKNVLKQIVVFMGKIGSEKLKPKKAEPEKKAPEEGKDEVTAEMLEKLKAIQAEKKE